MLLTALVGLALFLVPNLTIALILLVAWLGVAGWLVWRLEDWRNDIYQITDRYVMDIDRSPFGFGESRKQADLGNVQNATANKPGIVATLFNYGNVTVETAGASPDIIFERVAHPNRVQSDIFKRREQYRNRQRIQEGEQRRKEYAVLLDVYHQAQEQERIPKRTPDQEQ
jgi:hypothetical protein